MTERAKSATTIQPRPWVLVVEDEARLRNEFTQLLTAVAPDLGEICAVGSSEDALILCAASMPQVAFIDIHLPGRSGLELVAALPPDTKVVFVTAHDEFALRAFDQGAVDYLLKPISLPRLQVCVERLRSRSTLSAQQLSNMLANVSGAYGLVIPKAPVYLRWLTASSGKRTRLIPVRDVIYLQSDNKYTRIVCRDSEHLIEESLRSLLPRLDPAVFLQVHRATVVSLNEVLMVERDDAGGGLLHLRSCKSTVRISAPFLRELKAYLD